jgi:hypothetical protein
MVDEYTTAAMYGNAGIRPDPSNSPPETWASDEAVDAEGVDGLVARMARGELNEADDRAAKMGELGGTKDPVALHQEFVAATGGPDPNAPITNPVAPQYPDEIANAPVEDEPAATTETESVDTEE